jgi:hypothetical protein
MKLAVVTLVGLALCACTSGLHSQMKHDVSAEWGCPEGQIDVVSQGSDVYRVSGCGQSALYACDDGERFTEDDPHSGASHENEHRMGPGATCSRVRRDD